MARIYLVEDSEDLREATAAYLTREGHEVVEYGSADDLEQNKPGGDPDLYILDIMLPGTSGVSAAHKVRARGETPLIFISARDDEMTKAAAFQAGADDYVTKPYSPRELAMRVNAVLRRARRTPPESDDPATTIQCAQGTRTMVVDFSSRRIRISGDEVALTRTEWGILSAICRARGAIVTREQILHRVFGYDTDADSRALDTHIKNLRRKLGSSDWVETVHGQGYRLAAPLTE